MGSIFHASDCLHCTSESRIKQVLSAPSTAQKLGGTVNKIERLGMDVQLEKHLDYAISYLWMQYALCPVFFIEAKVR